MGSVLLAEGADEPVSLAMLLSQLEVLAFRVGDATLEFDREEAAAVVRLAIVRLDAVNVMAAEVAYSPDAGAAFRRFERWYDGR